MTKVNIYTLMRKIATLINNRDNIPQFRYKYLARYAITPYWFYLLANVLKDCINNEDKSINWECVIELLQEMKKEEI